MSRTSNNGLRIAYLLLTSSRPLTVKEICAELGCDRKTVYKNIDIIECAGFCTYIYKNGSHDGGNKYAVTLRG